MWWAIYATRDYTVDQFIEDVNCLGALRRTKRAAYREKKSQVYEYSFDPSQDTKFDEGDGCIWFAQSDMKIGTIFSIDEDKGLVEIKVSDKQGTIMVSTGAICRNSIPNC